MRQHREVGIVTKVAVVLALSATAACSQVDTGSSSGESANGESSPRAKDVASAPLEDTTAPGAAANGDAPAPGALSAERAVAAKLGTTGNFLIGLGNDSEGNADHQMMTYSLGEKLDIHYLYLSGLDWPKWNSPEGAYVTKHATAAKSRGIVPMFTLYQAAAQGENNLGAFATKDFMTKYWHGVRVMFERLGEFDAPAIVHVEPDLWGYTQKRSDDPAAVPMVVGEIVPECSDLPSNVAGMAKCVIRLSRAIAPKVVIGLSASSFGAYTNGQSDPSRIGQYMNALGAGEADLMVIETLDRDAGCFELGVDPLCKRAGSFYWDETNVAHPSFHDHLAWAKTIREVVGRPLLWWQMPLGAPAAGAGGALRYRDNRVRYLFSHPEEFAAAGGIGAVFGTGAPNQTTIRTDGGQFEKAISGYFAAPAPLR